ncbi:MAG: right-handed parallel beta-helix repeat-containing protein, partial [Gemmatimonadaceae bacterium]
MAACVLAGPSAVGAVGGSTEPPRSRAHYAAPDGRADGTGAPDRPWDLATALAGAGGRVRAGDVVWVRGGTYRGKFRSTLVGSARAPVVVRAAHGERATIEGRLRVDGSDVTVWGLEIRQSGAGDEPGLYALAPGGRYVNLVIHDAGENGVSLRSESGFTELYGCIVYDNGDDEHLDQGVYAPNDAGDKRITDNVFFNNMASGIQVYVTATHPLLTNVRVEGNISFNNSSIAPAISEENATVGGATVTERVAIVGNVLYFAGGRGHNLRFGLEGKDNRDVVVRDNYVVGGATVVRTENFAKAVVENNTFVGAARLVRIGAASLAGHRWAGNVHYRDPSARAWSV